MFYHDIEIPGGIGRMTWLMDAVIGIQRDGRGFHWINNGNLIRIIYAEDHMRSMMTCYDMTGIQFHIDGNWGAGWPGGLGR